MDGDEPHGSEAPTGGPDVGVGVGLPADQAQEADWVVTTVVDGNDPDGFDLGQFGGAAPAAPAPPPLVMPEPPPPGPPPPPPPPAAVTAPAVEGLADALAGLRHAVRQEFERCAGVLFSHDRALVELNERLAGLVGRLDEVELQAAAMPAAPPLPPPLPAPVPPAAETAHRSPELYDQALGHILDEVEGLDRRLQAVDPVELGPRIAGIEGRLAALEPLPAVVQALRTVVKESEAALAAEAAARQSPEGFAPVPADALEQLAGRLIAVEERLAPVEGLPDDVAALGRIVRRELDAVTADVQAREQVLRRALQKEIELLQGPAEDREEAARDAAQRLDLLERRVRGTAQANEDAVATTTRRLEALESRLVSVDALADDIDTLRAAARRELERLRASTQSHDQSLTEAGKRFADLDGRVSRLDSLPGEVQSLRSALRQEGDRTAVGLRSIEERAGEASDKAFRQLRQLAEAVTDANDRIGGLSAEMQSIRAALRGVEAALAATAERVDALTPQPAVVVDPGTTAEPAATGDPEGSPAPTPAG